LCPLSHHCLHITSHITTSPPPLAAPAALQHHPAPLFAKLPLNFHQSAPKIACFSPRHPTPFHFPFTSNALPLPFHPTPFPFPFSCCQHRELDAQQVQPLRLIYEPFVRIVLTFTTGTASGTKRAGTDNCSSSPPHSSKCMSAVALLYIPAAVTWPSPPIKQKIICVKQCNASARASSAAGCSAQRGSSTLFTAINTVMPQLSSLLYTSWRAALVKKGHGG
jgi:hypothetical protein